MLDQDLINRIRSISLHQRPHVSIAEATVLLGWSRGEMSSGDGDGRGRDQLDSSWQVAVAGGVDGQGELWAPEVIEEALGADAAGVLPHGIRLDDLYVRLPRHHIAMLRHFAERERTTVSGALARTLDAVASAHADELSWRIGGLADVLAWPDAELTQLPC